MSPSSEVLSQEAYFVSDSKSMTLYRSDSLTVIVPREFSLCKARGIPVADVLRKSSLISNADKQFVELCCYMCS